ncbi:hypothetical protein MHT86_09770 [Corynebacterium mastitidis]|uniref:hypothetical protein n=1 Tax=Corynebacterium mastitidis TaxID=161890 RepID=UPI00037EDC35|nr:hypothetical protein [Corynebacterium mastitidis]MCH6197775.1 hypothetical protein [Corynebacterium mastitidis]MDK8450627.1 hypothetical protein [Corynebacterium mastitidis]
MNNMTLIGIAFGLAVALATAFGGFGGFVAALIFGALGGVVGAQIEGRIDLRAFWDSLTSGRGGRG